MYPNRQPLPAAEKPQLTANPQQFLFPIGLTKMLVSFVLYVSNLLLPLYDAFEPSSQMLRCLGHRQT